MLETTERHLHSGVFIDNFEHISHIFLLFLVFSVAFEQVKVAGISILWIKIFFVILRNETILLLFFNGKVLDMFPTN